MNTSTAIFVWIILIGLVLSSRSPQRVRTISRPAPKPRNQCGGTGWVVLSLILFTLPWFTDKLVDTFGPRSQAGYSEHDRRDFDRLLDKIEGDTVIGHRKPAQPKKPKMTQSEQHQAILYLYAQQ